MTNTFHMPPVSDAQKIAREFSRILNEWFTPEQLAEVNRLNATPEYQDCCATHNFFDTNEAMSEAFQAATGREIDLQSDEDLNLWSEAWTIAKANKFSL